MKYSEFEAEIWGYNEKNQKENFFWLHPGDENVIGIRAFKISKALL